MQFQFELTINIFLRRKINQEKTEISGKIRRKRRSSRRKKTRRNLHPPKIHQAISPATQIPIPTCQRKKKKTVRNQIVHTVPDLLLQHLLLQFRILQRGSTMLHPICRSRRKLSWITSIQYQRLLSVPVPG